MFSNRISEQLLAEAIALFAVSAAEMPSHDFISMRAAPRT